MNIVVASQTKLSARSPAYGANRILLLALLTTGLCPFPCNAAEAPPVPPPSINAAAYSQPQTLEPDWTKFPLQPAAAKGVRIIKASSGRTLHRFFDTSPFSPSGRYLAVFRFPREDRPPQPGETGEVVLVDLTTGQEKTVAQSRGYEMQLGANVQWGATDSELYFNDVDTQTWQAFAGSRGATIGLLSAMFDEKRLHQEAAPLMLQLGVALGSLLEGAEGDIFTNRIERKPLPVPTHNNNKIIKTEDTNELEAGARRPRPARSVRARDGRR